MASDIRSSWAPEWAVTPGDVLSEALEERGMTQAELARRMDRPLKTISEIVNGKAAITPDTAIQLERSLGISAAFWNGLESRFRQAQAEARARDELAGYWDWASEFPIAAMRQADMLPPETSRPGTVAALLSLLGVANPQGWERRWREPAVALRASSVHESTPQALSAWLAWGEARARERSVDAFDWDRLLDAVSFVRELTLIAMFDRAFDQLKEVLGQAGVVAVLAPSLPKAPISGASYWITRDRAVIQVTLRYRSDDQFWFTVAHEIGHLLSHTRAVHVDSEPEGDTPDHPAEVEANAFARDALIPRDAYDRFLATADFREASVTAFAKDLGIAFGIVVGRLQHDHHLGPSALNHLKHSY